MGAPGLTSPIRPEGFEKLELNAGVFIPNFNLSLYGDADELRVAVATKIEAEQTLGMTSGGGTFTITRESRTPEVDGRRYLHKGAQFIDSMDAYLSSTLVEITGDNWVNIIGTAELASGKYKVKTAFESGSYMTRLVWVGDLADGRMIGIEIQNALNIADIAFTFADKNEGKLPFEMHAHQGDVLAYDTAPVKLFFFGENYNANPSKMGVSGTEFELTEALPAGTYEVRCDITGVSSSSYAMNNSSIAFMNGDTKVTEKGFGQVIASVGAKYTLSSTNSSGKALTISGSFDNIVIKYHQQSGDQLFVEYSSVKVYKA